MFCQDLLIICPLSSLSRVQWGLELAVVVMHPCDGSLRASPLPRTPSLRRQGLVIRTLVTYHIIKPMAGFGADEIAAGT